MASQRMPGARWVARRGNRNMVGGPPRATHHITWDQLDDDGTRLITLDGVTNYLLDKGYEPHVVIDPFTGEARQLLEAEASGFALENNGVQTNRRGRVNLQVEWFFTPGTVYGGRRYAALTDTPMRGLEEFLAWCDGWGIPRVAPLAPKDRDQATWAGTAGHYGHFNAPLNSHTDPIVPIASILAKAAPSTPQEDHLFSPSPIAAVHLIASHSGLLLTSEGDRSGAGVVQARANGSLNQRWQLVGHVDGTVSFVSRAGDMALDRPNGADAAGTALQVWAADYNPNQRWAVQEIPGAPLVRRLWAPGTNRCIDIEGASQDRARAILWTGKAEHPLNQLFVQALTV